MVCRPKRDKKRDEYVEENDIDYETAGMTVNGVRWNYQIFSSQGEPTIDYGDVGDVAIHQNLFWYRDSQRWREVNRAVDDDGRPLQKHPLLKGRYRFDCDKGRWRNSTGYKRKNPIVIICQHHDSSHNNNTLKEEQRSPESFMLRKVKGEPIHIDLSNDNHWTFSNPHVDEGRARKTIFIDLSLERDAPPRRVAFLLPHSTLSPLASHSATPQASSLPPTDNDDDDMYMSSPPVQQQTPAPVSVSSTEYAPRRTIVPEASDSSIFSETSDGISKKEEHSTSSKPAPEHLLWAKVNANLDRHLSEAAKDRKAMLKMMNLQRQQMELQRAQMEQFGKRLDLLEAQRRSDNAATSTGV